MAKIKENDGIYAVDTNSNVSDELINKNKGFTEMGAGNGDDTYIINDISKSFTKITDGYQTVDRDSSLENKAVNPDIDTLIVKNVNANDLMFFFDVNINATTANTLDNNFFIIRKKGYNSAFTQILKYYDSDIAPQSNAILVEDYYKNLDTYNAESGMPDISSGYISKLQVVDKAGITKTIDLSSYIPTVTQKVRDLLKNTNFTTAEALLKNGSNKQKSELLKIYKNNLVNIEIVGTSSNNKLTGEANVTNTFVFKAGDGKDKIIAGNGTDIVKINTVDFSNLKFTMSSTSGLIINYTNNDSVEIAGYLKKFKTSVDKIITSDGEHKLSDMKDSITIQIDKSGETRKQTIIGTSIKDNITGSGLKDTIKSGLGNDTITAGKGNDKLFAQGGDNTFIFNKGDNNDTLISSSKGNDTLQFNFDSFEDANMKFTARGKDLIIYYGDKDNYDSVAVKDYLKKPQASSIKTIKFGENGEEYELSFLLDKYKYEFEIEDTNKKHKLTGTNYDDKLVGSGYADTLTGYKGDDIFYAGKGKDKIYGTDGNNIMFFKAGDGIDTVYNGKGEDTLVFEDISNIQMLKEGNDLVVTGYSTNTTTDRVIVKDYFILKNPSVKYIAQGTISDDLVVDYDKYQIPIDIQEEFETNGVNIAVQKNKKYGDNTYIGSKYNDSISCEGYCYIDTGNGDDVIGVGGEGGTVYAGDGDDLIYRFSNDNDSFYTSGIYAYGGAGNDMYDITNSRVNPHYYNEDYTETCYRIRINDSEGEDDLLILPNSMDDQRLFFDLKVNKNGNIINKSSINLYIYDKFRFTPAYYSFYHGADPNDYSSLFKFGKYGDQSGLEIKNYFDKDGTVGDGCIETIKAGIESITAEEIMKIKDNLAERLSEICKMEGVKSITTAEALNLGYTDILDIFRDFDVQYDCNYVTGTDGDDELLQKYDGNDYVKLLDGTDVVNAGKGNDIIDSTLGSNTVIIDEDSGTDTVIIGTDNETTIKFDESEKFLYFCQSKTNTNDLIIARKFDKFGNITVIQDYFAKTNAKVYYQFQDGAKTQISVSKNDLGYVAYSDDSIEYTKMYTEMGIKNDELNRGYTFVYYDDYFKGEHEMQVNGLDKSNLMMFFNVYKNGYQSSNSYSDNNIYIIDKSDKILNNNVKDLIISNYNYGGTYKLADEDGEDVINISNDLQTAKASIIENVKAFLSDKNYISSYEVFSYGKVAEKEELLNIYKNAIESAPKSNIQSMSLGASNTGINELRINELNYQVVSFTSTGTSDMQLNNTISDINDISVVMSEYTNMDLQNV